MLDELEVPVKEERLAKKAPLADSEVRHLLGTVREVVLAKGKSTRTVAAKDATLDDLRGPTGNFRAPMTVVGKTLLVGFHAETLRRLLRGD